MEWTVFPKISYAEAPTFNETVFENGSFWGYVCVIKVKWGPKGEALIQ